MMSIGIFPYKCFKNMKIKIYAYLSGWSRRVSVSVETGIGLTMSYDNGKHLRMGNGPVLTSSLSETIFGCRWFVKTMMAYFICGISMVQIGLKLINQVNQKEHIK